MDTRPELIGERIRELRHYRGMALKTLAGLAGLSVGFLSMVENGKRTIERRSHLVAVAGALQVSVSELIGQPLAPVDAEHSAALSTVPAIRAALVDLSFGADDHELTRTLAELRDDVAAITKARKDCDYVRMGRLAPDVLRDLDAASRVGSEDSRRAALRLLVHAAYCTTYALKYLGFPDLSMRAAESCHLAAERLGEPLWLGIADFTRLHSLPPDSRRVVARLSTAAADRLQPYAEDEDAQRVYGMLHLTAALSSAVECNTSSVQAHLDEAGQVASRLDDRPGFAEMWFGPTNYAFWRMAIAVELGEGGKAAEIARDVHPELVESNSRRAAFYSDLGRGLAQTRRADYQAVRALATAERLAPQRVRTNPAVREAVADILRRARREAGGRELRGLAHRCSVA